jgi:glycolate oxidase iron-sulfur subunit
VTDADQLQNLGPLRQQYDNMLNCIRCGLCLATCPTYQLSFAEEEGPRGRIAIARALTEGHLDLSEDLIAHEESCLLCEACTAVCPAGVRMEPIGIALRDVIATNTQGNNLFRRALRWFVFRCLLANMGLFRAACGVARLYQGSGLAAAGRRLGLLGLLRLADLEALLPRMDRHFFIPRDQVFEPVEPLRGEAALFVGCIMSTAFAETNRATARVLCANGYRVTASKGQTCCGALHVHSGEITQARALARANIDAFDARGHELPVVVNAAGCGSTLKGYAHLLASDSVYAQRAAKFAARVKDISELLSEGPVRPPGHAVERTVTFQDPCHLAYAQRIRHAPRRLLRSIPGLKFVEMEESALCCGSAGVYNVTHPAEAQALLARKVRAVHDTGAEIVVTANPGCLLQLQTGLRRAGSAVPVCHIVDLLDQAYQGPDATVGG